MVLYLLIDINKHYRFCALNFVSSYTSSNAKAIRNAKYICMDEQFTYIKMAIVLDYMKITIYRQLQGRQFSELLYMQYYTHDSPMWLYNSCINSKVCWRTRIWLNIDTPLCRIKLVSLQCPLLA